MNRQHLVDTLEMMKPALAPNDTIPIFQCFCFHAGEITAFNDTIGIVGTIDFNDSCGIHGPTLLGLLGASRSEEIEILVGDKDLTLKAGKGISTLPFSPTENFIFEKPILKDCENLTLTQSFMEALGLCLETVSADETQPKLHGITLVKNKMFSCNGDTITQVVVKAPIKGQVLLSTEFCESLVRLWGKLTLTKGELFIGDEWAHAEFEEWQIYGKIKEITDPINFDALVKKTIKSKVEPQPIPENLSEALSRARVLADPESQRTEILVSKGKMTLFTSTHMGDVEDFIAFKGHPDVRANVNASHLQRAVKHCDQMAIHENCVVFEKAPNVLLLVSNME